MAAKESITYTDRTIHPSDYLMEGKPPMQENVQTSHGAEHDHSHEMDTAWQAAGEAHTAYLNMFDGQREAVLTPDSALFAVFEEHVVQKNDTIEVICIDERCGHRSEGYNIGIGGSGILVSPEKKAAYVKYIVDTAIAKRVKKIVIDAHEGCGAAKLSLGQGTHSDEKVNDTAKVFSNGLADEVRAELKARSREDVVVEMSFRSFEEMHAPASFHNAVGIMVDTTGQFDPTRRKDKVGSDLPPVFNVNGIYDYDHAMANVGVALSIAFGGHGFGPDRFSSERPFVITLVHDGGVDSADLSEKIDQTVAKFAKDYSAEKHVEVADKISVKVLNVAVATKHSAATVETPVVRD